MYGGERSMITVNMSEYQEAHSVAGLKGAPPGYVGYGQGGVFTESVRRRPYSVILLDEVEKAHPDVCWSYFFKFLTKV
ncbi:AAA family ATPase [Arsenophonus endosymbiont of Aleurodicus floccissimus]|uniref:AAA family ATPase n=1 Tax=Arsenophonus endosymbiont of Aleurodicus floccissimus TaxID=2152761 RepID=UPI0021072BCC|nr:AAA family ATPase [Arsenophonus endosymbiont of Aleurodicus floccissimus]